MSAADMKGIADQRKAPEVNPAYPRQRYFQPLCSGMPVPLKNYPPQQDVRVYRDAAADYVDLTIRLGYLGELTANLDASELRELALTLLDAAYDIDVNPAAVLMQTNVEEEGPTS